MKTAIRVMILIGIIGFTSCSNDMDEIMEEEVTLQSGPGDDDDDDDCKGGCE